VPRSLRLQESLHGPQVVSTARNLACFLLRPFQGPISIQSTSGFILPPPSPPAHTLYATHLIFCQQSSPRHTSRRLACSCQRCCCRQAAGLASHPGRSTAVQHARQECSINRQTPASVAFDAVCGMHLASASPVQPEGHITHNVHLQQEGDMWRREGGGL
jgi:hypothetical protein